MDYLQSLFTKYQYPIQKESHEIEKELNIIEKELHWKIPDDYKYYILKYQNYDIEINDHFIITWPVQELLETNRLNFWIEQEVFAIGGDGGGSFFGYDISPSENNRIVCDNMIGCERQYFTEIGSSFTDLFKRLENRISWYP